MHTGHTANFDGTIYRENSDRMTDTQTHIHVQRKARSPKTSSTSNGKTATLQGKFTFERYSFPNGLTLIAKEVHSAPVVSFWVWYRVGARNEHIGITGISHWVEHMLFKGTPTFPAGSIHGVIAENGGTLNGFTSDDFTAYFETLPSDRWELALQI